MELKRINAGHYVVTDGTTEVVIRKNLDRSWNVTPTTGERVTVYSYADAKATAVELIGDNDNAAPHPTFVNGPAPVDYAERLKRFADKLLAMAADMERQTVA